MRIAAPVIGPIWLIEFRVLLAGLALLPMLIRLNFWPQIRQNWWPLLVVGGINSALPFSLLAFASVVLPAGFTSILNATAPLFGTVVAAIWLKEKLTITQRLGFLLGFAGVVVLVGRRPVTLTPDFGLAVAAGLLGALSYAIAAPYIKQNMAGVSSLAVTTGSQLGAALLLLPALPFTVPQQPLTLTVIGSVITLALLSTAFAYILYFRLIQSIGSTKALTVTYLVPLFAMLWGALMLQEPITLAMVVGCGLILLGTAITNNFLQSLSSLSAKS
jgi:drug/metabolite transporter (DMT)-like permease